MVGIFRHVVYYYCLSFIPISNAEKCLRTCEEHVSQNGSAVCFATTGTAPWVRGSLGHSFLLLFRPPNQTDIYILGRTQGLADAKQALSV